MFRRLRTVGCRAYSSLSTGVRELPPTHIEIAVMATPLTSSRSHTGQGVILSELVPPYVSNRAVSGVVTRIGEEADAEYTTPLEPPWSEEPITTPTNNEIRVGDEVILGQDAYRTNLTHYTNIHPAAVARKPANLTHAQAATLPFVGLTAYEALFDVGKVREGQTVFVYNGSDLVQTACIQLAKLMKCHVTTTATPAKVDLVRGYGADDVWVLEEGEHLLFSGPKPFFDLVLDSRASDLPPINVLEPKLPPFDHVNSGRFISLAHPIIKSSDADISYWPTMRCGGPPGLNEVLNRFPSLVDTPRYIWKGERFGLLARAVERGELAVPAHRVFALDDLEEAHKAFKQEGGSLTTKIVLDMSEG